MQHGNVWQLTSQRRHPIPHMALGHCSRFGDILAQKDTEGGVKHSARCWRFKLSFAGKSSWCTPNHCWWSAPGEFHHTDSGYRSGDSVGSSAMEVMPGGSWNPKNPASTNGIATKIALQKMPKVHRSSRSSNAKYPAYSGNSHKMIIDDIPSGELTVHHGKSPCFMGTSTISMAIFHSFLYVHQAG